MHKLFFLQLLFFSFALSATERMQNPKTNVNGLSASISASGLEIISSEAFDKFSISISNVSGFSKTFESDSPHISIAELELPQNGEYLYEIKAIKILGFDYENTNSLNNGRDTDAQPLKTKVSVTSGQLINNWGNLVESESLSESNNNLGYER